MMDLEEVVARAAALSKSESHLPHWWSVHILHLLENNKLCFQHHDLSLDQHRASS